MPNRLDSLRAQIQNLVATYAQESLAPPAFEAGRTPIPPSGKLLGTAELQNMVDAALDGWLTAGRFNEAFEKALTKFLGVKHALTVNSGSSANLLAFQTLTSPKLGERALRPGDEVLTVAAGFPTTVNPILQFGAVPVFLEVELGTYNLDVTQLEAARSDRTRAVMLAHTLGNPFNVKVVKKFCERYGLWLIEDCCDALGSTFEGEGVGTFGDIATLSFYPAHHITMGEGGAVFMRSGRLRKIAESFRDWGRDCYCSPGKDNTCSNRYCWTASQLGGSLPDGYDHKYIYSHLGYNLKISDMQAACGLAQLKKAPDFIAQRRRNFAFLREALEPLSSQLLMPKATDGSEPSWFGFPITVRSEARLSRAELLSELGARGIGTRLLFAGNLTRQPYMVGRNFRTVGRLSVTDQIMLDTFWLGVQPALTEPMLEYVADSLKALLMAQIRVKGQG